MTYRMTKILTKFWVWEKYSNIGRSRKKSSRRIGSWRKTFSNSLLYTLSKKQKKIPHVPHVRVSLKLSGI